MGVCGAEECTRQDTFSKYEKLGYDYTIVPKKVEKSSTYDTVDSYYRPPVSREPSPPVVSRKPSPPKAEVPMREKKSPAQLVKEPESSVPKNKKMINRRDIFQKRQAIKKENEDTEKALAKKKAEEEALLKQKEEEKLNKILKEKEDRLRRKEKKSEELKNRINKNLRRRA